HAEGRWLALPAGAAKELLGVDRAGRIEVAKLQQDLPIRLHQTIDLRLAQHLAPLPPAARAEELRLAVRPALDEADGLLLPAQFLEVAEADRPLQAVAVLRQAEEADQRPEGLLRGFDHLLVAHQGAGQSRRLGPARHVTA